jgi:hypothetical protein
MIDLTAEERDAMNHLEDYAQRAFRSKRVLRILSRLNEQGFIEFDPFVGRAELTESGRKLAAS